MGVRFRWLGTACFEFVAATGEGLLVDPYLDEAFNCPVRSAELNRVDLICITHGHFDHVLDVGRVAGRLGSTVLCSPEVAETLERRLGVPRAQIRTVEPGEEVIRGALRVEVVPGVHVDNRLYFAEQLGLDVAGLSVEELVRMVFAEIQDTELRDRLLASLGKYPAGPTLNYVFVFPGNIRIYYFGSTPDPSLFPVVEAAAPQVMVLQLLCNREEAALEVARRSGASLIIPSHHDAFFPGQKIPDLWKVTKGLEGDPVLRFLDPRPGRWYEIVLSSHTVQG